MSFSFLGDYKTAEVVKNPSNMFDSIDITLATVNSVIAITSIAGNSLVCFVIIKNRDMRYTLNINTIEISWSSSLSKGTQGQDKQ